MNWREGPVWADSIAAFTMRPIFFPWIGETVPLASAKYDAALVIAGACPCGFSIEIREMAGYA
jgi:hypothetical protein